MDSKELRLALSRFEAFRANLPSWIKEETVVEYHGIVDAVASATGETGLDQFKIADSELAQKVVSFQIGGYGGSPGRTNLSRDRYCDDDRFKSRVQGLATYLESEGHTISNRTQPDRRKPLHADVYIENMTGSAVQHGTSHSSISFNTQYHTQEFGDLIQKIKTSLPQWNLTPDQKNEAYTDVATVEVQLKSPKPKHPVIIECLKSLRSIIEGVAANAITLALTRYIPQ